jgi:hypothetical protein
MNLSPANDFGDTLKTRFLGAQLHERIVTALSAGDAVTVDFSGVKAMGPSFSDECFGTLIIEHGSDLFRTRLHLTAMNEGVKAVLRLVFKDRGTPARP